MVPPPTSVLMLCLFGTPNEGEQNFPLLWGGSRALGGPSGEKEDMWERMESCGVGVKGDSRLESPTDLSWCFPMGANERGEG